MVELFEVNTRLNELLPLLPGSNAAGSNVSGSNAESNPESSPIDEVTTTQEAAPQAVTTVATSLLLTATSSNGEVTTTSPASYKREVGSNSDGRNETRKEQIERDRRLASEALDSWHKGYHETARRKAALIYDFQLREQVDAELDTLEVTP